jgi:hypothetical protein
MKALRQLGFLKLSLRPEGAAGEDHRVLALFRNRAELKKAYGGLQEETFRLKDLVKQQEGATQRVQDMLNALESRLGAADTAYPALVFYQLRGLWQAGRELVERRAHLAQHNRRLFARRQEAEEQLRSAQALHADATEHVGALAAERAKLTRLWHYFKRRALERRIGAAQAVLSSAGTALDEARARLEELTREATAQFPGLSLPARRAINLAAIACAEAVVARLAELKTPLVQLAREATGRREVADEYGTPKECVLLMGQIAHAHRLLEAREGLAHHIRARCERLKRVARYRNATDSAPLADSLAYTEADVLQADADGTGPVPNVLGEDIFDLFRILVR